MEKIVLVVMENNMSVSDTNFDLLAREFEEATQDIHLNIQKLQEKILEQKQKILSLQTENEQLRLQIEEQARSN